MDTRSRKSHKLTVSIIALCVMIPALILVSLYPRMEEAMLEKREVYEKEYNEVKEESLEGEPEWWIERKFINYAVEASYYLYAKTMEKAVDQETDYEFFEIYGWDSDYYHLNDNATYMTTYLPGGDAEAIILNNAEQLDPQIAKLTLEFDAFGKITAAGIEGDVKILENSSSIQDIAENSIRQFHNNVGHYREEFSGTVDESQYTPKNFKAEFALNDESDFVWNYVEYYEAHHWYDTSSEHLYAVTGAYIAAAVMAVVAMVAAFILPFIKKLDTGRERIFSLPFEVMIMVAIGGISLAIGMGLIMSHTTMWELTSAFKSSLPEFLGFKISVKVLYRLLLAANFVGWVVSFFLLYMVASAIRQMITRPVFYLKNQVLFVRLLRWMKRKCMQLYHYITDIDINEKLNGSIIKVVIANFAILTVLCSLWFFGVVVLIPYSIALYAILKNEGKKIQNQYQSILHATEQMADGDLRISLDKDLGVFTPIGESLEKVQQGFKKAVVEEAKSQSMKTELITNVSHDLKTPLTAIITYVDLLKKEDLTEEERASYIAILEQKSRRLKVLIEDLFEVSKAHSGNVKMNFMDVDVVSLLKQVRSEMDEQIEESKLQFRWKLPEEKVIISLDGQRTYRIFENLLNNILKYAMPNSRVYIDVIPVDTEVKILFRNVSEMELDIQTENLTERFVRGDAARNSEGSGLGLAIVKSFVELQNGTFKVEVDGDLFKAEIMFPR